MVQAQELADAVERLQAAKPVYAFLSSGDTKDFLIASAAGKVSMDPAGSLEITGLAGEMMFFRDTLAWLGIEPQFIQIGRFKGAAEPMTATQPSAELQQVYGWLLDDLYAQMCEQIARQRHITKEQAVAAIDAGPLSAGSAKEHALVDQLVEGVDWQDFVTQSVSRKGAAGGDVEWVRNYGRKTRASVDLSNPFALFRSLAAPSEQAITDPTIAIIHVDGMIVSGVSGEGMLSDRRVGDRTLTACLRKVAEDDRVKAVILRINSPGGSAIASEQIYQAVRRLAEKKPVIASVSQMAASGGYYIAVGANRILADPAALTGSIGVISGKLAFSDLLGKLKINRYEMTRGKNAGMWLTRPWNAREQEIIRSLAQQTYELFVRRVAQSRAGKIKSMDAVAQGRVFTARQAVENGLIDGIGGMREAMAAAQNAAHTPRCRFVTLPHRGR